VEGLLFTWESSASITVPDVSATPAISLGSDWTTIQFGPVTPGAPADSLSLNVIACDDGL
jgi:hypothetical protein